MTKAIWIVIGVAFVCAQSMWIGRSTQGVYEDHAYVQTALSRTTAPTVIEPILWQRLQSPHGWWSAISDARQLIPARGLVRWSIWREAHASAHPRLFRTVNAILAAVASLLVGVLAWRLGAPAWAAAGVMALHPLTVEAIAMIAGRFEIVSTIGVLMACLAMTGDWWARLYLRLPLLVSGLVLGWMGQETIGTALVLVPLVMLQRRHAPVLAQRAAWFAFAGGAITMLVAAFYARLPFVAMNVQVDAVEWIRIQAAATTRLLILSVLPFGQTVDYDYDALSVTWQTVAALHIPLALIAAFWAWRKLPVFALGLAWIVCVTIPRLIVATPRSYLNEHQFYLAFVGVALIGASLVPKRV